MSENKQLIDRLEKILEEEYPTKYGHYSPAKFDKFTTLPFLNEKAFEDVVRLGLWASIIEPTTLDALSEHSSIFGSVVGWRLFDRNFQKTKEIELNPGDYQLGLEGIFQWFREKGETEHKEKFLGVCYDILRKFPQIEHKELRKSPRDEHEDLERFPRINYEENMVRILNQDENEYITISREFVKRTIKIIGEYQKQSPDDPVAKNLLEIFDELDDTLTGSAIEAHFNQDFRRNCQTSIGDVCLFDGGNYPQMSRIFSLDPTIHLLDFSPEKPQEGQPQAMAFLIEAKDEKGREYLVVDGVPCNDKFDILKPREKYKSNYEYIFSSVIKYAYENYLKNPDKSKKKEISLFINTRQWANLTGKGTHEFLESLSKLLCFKYEYSKQSSPKGGSNWNITDLDHTTHTTISLKKDNQPLEEILKRHNFSLEEISETTKFITHTWGNIRESDYGWNHCDDGTCNGIVLSHRKIKKLYLQYYGSKLDKSLYHLPRLLGLALAAIVGGGVVSYNWPVVCENAVVDNLTIKCDVDKKKPNRVEFPLEIVQFDVNEIPSLSVRASVAGEKYEFSFRNKADVTNLTEALSIQTRLQEILENPGKFLPIDYVQGIYHSTFHYTPYNFSWSRESIEAYIAHKVPDLSVLMRVRELMHNIGADTPVGRTLLYYLVRECYNEDASKIKNYLQGFSGREILSILRRDSGPEISPYIDIWGQLIKNGNVDSQQEALRLLDYFVANDEIVDETQSTLTQRWRGHHIFKHFSLTIPNLDNNTLTNFLRFANTIRERPHSEYIMANLMIVKDRGGAIRPDLFDNEVLLDQIISTLEIYSKTRYLESLSQTFAELALLQSNIPHRREEHILSNSFLSSFLSVPCISQRLEYEFKKSSFPSGQHYSSNPYSRGFVMGKNYSNLSELIGKKTTREDTPFFLFLRELQRLSIDAAPRRGNYSFNSTIKIDAYSSPEYAQKLVEALGLCVL